MATLCFCPPLKSFVFLLIKSPNLNFFNKVMPFYFAILYLSLLSISKGNITLFINDKVGIK